MEGELKVRLGVMLTEAAEQALLSEYDRSVGMAIFKESASKPREGNARNDTQALPGSYDIEKIQRDYQEQQVNSFSYMKTMCMASQDMTPNTVKRAKRAVSVAGKSETVLGWEGVQKSDHKDRGNTSTFPATPAGSRVGVAQGHVSATNAEVLAKITALNRQTVIVAEAEDNLLQHQVARAETPEQSKEIEALAATVTAKDREDFDNDVGELTTSGSLTRQQKMDAIT